MKALETTIPMDVFLLIYGTLVLLIRLTGYLTLPAKMRLVLCKLAGVRQA